MVYTKLPNAIGKRSIIWRLRGEGGFTQTIRVPSYGGRGLANRRMTFLVAERAKFTVPLFMVYGEEVENVIGGEGLAEKFRIQSYWEGGQNCSKICHRKFEHFLGGKLMRRSCQTRKHDKRSVLHHTMFCIWNNCNGFENSKR